MSWFFFTLRTLFKPYSMDIYQDTKRRWRWRVKAPNGEVVGASSEGFVTEFECEANYNRLTSSFCKVKKY